MLKKVLIGLGIILVTGATVVVVDQKIFKKKYGEVKLDENGDPVKNDNEGKEEEEAPKTFKEKIDERIIKYAEKITDWVLDHEREVRALRLILSLALPIIFGIMKANRQSRFQEEVLERLKTIKEFVTFDKFKTFEGGWEAKGQDLSAWLKTIHESDILVDDFDNNQEYIVTRVMKDLAGGAA